MADICAFRKEYGFLSNFWPVEVQLDGIWYSSVEHAFQAAKTLDPTQREWFRDPAISAGKAKRIGRNLCPIRYDWDSVKLKIMEDLVRQKFNHIWFRRRLLSTVPVKLVEGNYWHDQFWGDCTCSEHAAVPGENHLGLILMKVRSELEH